MSEEVIRIQDVEIKVTSQFIYDACFMSLPEFVTHYRTVNGLPMAGWKYDGPLDKVPAHALREKYFELRDRIAAGQLEVDKSLTKSSLRKWYEDHGIDRKKIAEDYNGNLHILKKAAGQSITSNSQEVEDDEDDVMSDDFDISFLSRKEQVEFMLDEGIESPSEIAKKIGANPSYVQRLKKQILDDRES